MTSAIPVQRSTNWANKPTGSWLVCGSKYAIQVIIMDSSLFLVSIFCQLTSEKNQVHTCNLTHWRQTLRLNKFYLIINMKGNRGNWLAQFKFPFLTPDGKSFKCTWKVSCASLVHARIRIPFVWPLIIREKESTSKVKLNPRFFSLSQWRHTLNLLNWQMFPVCPTENKEVVGYRQKNRK